MDGLTVSQVARRSGVPASTVRFYDGIGLLRARRSAAGYRLFDDDASARLAFIATAKTLGLPLEQVRRVMEPWEDGSCARVHATLAPLLDAHLHTAREQRRSLDAFVARLARARDQLDEVAGEGPCDSSCAALGDVAASGDPFCSLPADAFGERVERWRSVLVGATAREAIPGGVRVTLNPAGASIADLAGLAAAEAECCPDLALTLRFGNVVELDAQAPGAALELVHALVGEPET